MVNGATKRSAPVVMSTDQSLPPERCAIRVHQRVYEDGHFLTLAYATSEGLEVREPDGNFPAVTTVPGQMVVMLGGIASLMTDGRLAPLFHRVRSIPSCEERTSVLFFADLAPDLCRPWIAGESNYSVDIGAHVRANPARFGLQRYGSE